MIALSLSPSPLQEIVPQSASSAVLDLFVPRSELEERKREAEALPKLNIDKLDCQWLQVHVYYIPYSQKYWQELNLAVRSRIAIANILADLNLTVHYGIAIHIYASKKF